MKADFQIGKSGITENFIETLRVYFTKHRNARVSILKSAGREDKEKLKNELLEKLGKKYTIKIIGFVFAVTKWRSDKRE